MGFSRQEYWSMLLFPSPGDLLDTQDWTHIFCVFCNGRKILYHCAIWEAPQHWYTHHLSLLFTSPCSHEIKRSLLLQRQTMTNLDSMLKSRDITLPTKVHLVKAMVFPVVIYGCESWTVKKAECQRIDAFELWFWRTLLRVLCKQIQPVKPKGNQSWIFIGRTDTEAETPICCPPDVKKWLTGIDPDAGKDRRQKEKEMTENEMVG